MRLERAHGAGPEAGGFGFDFGSVVMRTPLVRTMFKHSSFLPDCTSHKAARSWIWVGAWRSVGYGTGCLPTPCQSWGWGSTPVFPCHEALALPGSEFPALPRMLSVEVTHSLWLPASGGLVPPAAGWCPGLELQDFWLMTPALGKTRNSSALVSTQLRKM